MKTREFKFKPQVVRSINIQRDNFTPECHDNCQCEVIDGEWVFGESASGTCDYCREQAEIYRSGSYMKEFKTLSKVEFIFKKQK